MADPLRDLARDWTTLGATDPMWAALTVPARPGGRWDAAEFLASGHAEIDRMLRLLAHRGIEPRKGTALDFGCGPGRLSAALADAGFEHVLGVDVSPTMLAAAREMVPTTRCEFRLNEGADLAGIPSDSVDLVYCCRVLQHMPPVLAHSYVREFLRVAAPGAPVVFQLPAGPVPGLAGIVLRLLPSWVLVRLRRGMQMHGAPPPVVTRVVADAGGVTVSIEEDTSAGPRWHSYLYLVRPDR